MQLGLRKACRSRTGVGESIPCPSFSPFTGRVTMAYTHYTFKLKDSANSQRDQYDAPFEDDPVLVTVLPSSELTFKLTHATIGEETEVCRLKVAETFVRKIFDPSMVRAVYKSSFTIE